MSEPADTARLSETSVRDLLAGLPPSATAVRAAMFAALRAGRPVAVAELAAATGRPAAEVSGVLDQLQAAGMLYRDHAGQVTAADGLSLTPTRHRLLLAGVPLHTWCAIDAVAIPAAVGADATAITPCGWCGQQHQLSFTAGQLAGEHAAVVWLPTMRCTNVAEQLCPHANLFCDPTHLTAWRDSAGQPPGETLRLAEVADRAAFVWRALLEPR